MDKYEEERSGTKGREKEGKTIGMGKETED